MYNKKVQLLAIEREAVRWQGNKWGGKDGSLHLDVGGIKLRTLGVFLEWKRSEAIFISLSHSPSLCGVCTCVCVSVSVCACVCPSWIFH